MLLNLAQLRSREGFTPAICVVGAGFAGYEIAKAAVAAGRDVLVLESGGATFDPATQALANAAFTGAPLKRSGAEFNKELAATYLGLPAVRELGGTSNVWSGKWKPFDRLDLIERAWVPGSGWPIAWDELAPLYDEVRRDYGLGASDEPGPSAAPDGCDRSNHVEEAAPTRVKELFAELARSDKVALCLDATVTGMRLAEAPGGARVASLTVRSSREAEPLTIGVGNVVLAMGGLENPRLLLAADREAGAAILNPNDLVGRYYMDHPKIEWRVAVRPFARPAALPVTQGRLFRGLRLSDDEQARSRTLNHAIYVIRKSRFLRGDRYTNRLYLEQAPLHDSRVFLSGDRDAFGMPRLTVDWRLPADAADELDRFLAAMGSRLEQAGAPRPAVRGQDLVAGAFSTGNHHMGTTKMAASPKDGVVDADCRVFGTENLYVAGSSVSPTSGNANPTLTLVALAKRLGRKLASG